MYNRITRGRGEQQGIVRKGRHSGAIGCSGSIANRTAIKRKYPCVTEAAVEPDMRTTNLLHRVVPEERNLLIEL